MQRPAQSPPHRMRLQPAARFALSRTIEHEVTTASAACALRLVNRGVGNRSKLRVGGLYLRRRQPEEATCDPSGVDIRFDRFPGG